MTPGGERWKVRSCVRGQGFQVAPRSQGWKVKCCLWLQTKRRRTQRGQRVHQAGLISVSASCRDPAPTSPCSGYHQLSTGSVNELHRCSRGAFSHLLTSKEQRNREEMQRRCQLREGRWKSSKAASRHEKREWQVAGLEKWFVEGSQPIREAVISLLAPFHSKIRVKYSKIALQQGWDWEKVMAPCDHIMELRSSFSPHIFVSNVLQNSHFKKTMLLQRQINWCLL